MNAQQLAQTAYSSPVAPVRTARGTEYEVFGKITRRIRDSDKRGSSGFVALVEALHDNRRFWTLLALDVSGRDNELPDELRARLLYLNEFTQTHTSKVLAHKAEADILIEINTAVMRGLRGQGGKP